MMRKKSFKFYFKKLPLFVVIWLMVGFTTGTETLMGPVRWITNLSRQMKWDKSIEDLIVKFVIVLFAFASFVISLLLVRTIIKTNFWHVKFGILSLVFLATIGALYYWMNPQLFGIDKDLSEETIADAQFTFGPYPTEEL